MRWMFLRDRCVLLLPMGLLVACQAPAVAGGSCARSSECAEPLVCASGACRDACGDSRDCAASYSCVVYRGGGVCVPPSVPVPCVFNTDCGPLFCRSGHCVQQCASDHDCDHGTCAGGTCSEPVTTPSAPDAGTPRESGVDAGSSQCGSGQVFCQTDARCHDLLVDPQACGQCGLACASGGTCENGACVCGGMPCAPPNDHCANALPIVLDAQGHGSGVARMDGATADLAPCFAIAGSDVFFRVDVPVRSVMTAITRSGAVEPDIMDLGCGMPSTDCGDLCTDGVNDFDVAVVEAGPVYVAVRAEPSSTGASETLQIITVPIGDVEVSALSATATLGSGEAPTASVVVAPATRDSGCGHGDAHAFYWLRCGGVGVGNLDVTACPPSGGDLTLEALVPPSDCNGVDASGCAHISLLGSIEQADVYVVHAATGTRISMTATAH